MTRRLRKRKTAVTLMVGAAASRAGRDRGRSSSGTRGGRVPPGGGQRRPAAWVLLGLVFLTGSVAALFAGGGYTERRRLEARRDAANIELDRQLKRVHDLRREVERLHGDSLARERLAREELGYTKRGEMIFLLAEPSPRTGKDRP